MSTAEEQDLTIFVRADGPVTILHLSGEVDIGSAPALHGHLSELLGTDASIVVDLSNVSFMDSSGISVLIVAHKRAIERRQTLILRGPSGAVAKVLAVSGTDQVFTIEP